MERFTTKAVSGARIKTLHDAKDLGAGRDNLRELFDSAPLGDISEQRKAAKANLESGEMCRQLFEQGPAVMLVIDPDGGQITAANQEAASYYGWSVEEMLKLTIFDINPFLDANTDLSQRMRMIEGRCSKQYQSRHRLASGEVRDVVSSTGAIRIADKEQILAVIHDVSERKKAQKELADRQELLEAINHAQSLFIASRDSRAIYEELLRQLLKLTGSTLGFICEVLSDAEGGSYLRYNAVYATDGAEVLQSFAEQHWREGDTIDNLRNLFGAALTSGEAVIANDPEHDHRKGGLPEGHPGLSAFLGVPIRAEDRAVALLGLANRPDGYNREQIDFLQPLLATIGQLVLARRAEADRQEASAQQLASELYFRRLIDNSADAIFVHRVKDGRFVDCNQRALDSLGYSREEFLSLRVSDVECLHNQEDLPSLWSKLLLQNSLVIEGLHQRKDGSVFPVEVSLSLDKGNDVPLAICSVRDIAERVQAEREKDDLRKQLLQSQKIESLGRLAGGIAHDFNNMLAAILGNTELAMEKVSATDSMYHLLYQIKDAADRSAELTQQLLGFARKQPHSPSVIDLNVSVQSTLMMLRRLIGENINLDWQPLAAPANIYIDPAQLNQILVNLTVNARDAIVTASAGENVGRVGSLKLSTRNLSCKGRELGDSIWCEPGDYVCLTVSDTGCGMDRDVCEQIFDPFFTTKGVDEGTGLGLATVYGIVKQNRGYIMAESEPGQGTTFSIFFPVAQTEPQPLQQCKLQPLEPLQKGDEIVLLVEDEEMILELAHTVLEESGYQVMSASSPVEALEIAESLTGAIDLLITDVIMPEMNGLELAAQLQASFPGIKILLMSGYTADVISNHGRIDSSLHFLQKPFRPSELTAKVRHLLDSGSVPCPA